MKKSTRTEMGISRELYKLQRPQVGAALDAFTPRLVETAEAMKVADGFEPGAVIGPLIDMKAVEKVEAHIPDAVKKAPRSSPAASAAHSAALSSNRPC